MKLTEQSSRLLLLLALVAATAAQVYSATTHLPMFLDGAYWYFNVIQNETFFYDVNYARYSGVLLQLPAVAWLAVWGNAGTRGAIAALDFAYALHPIVSLGATYLILHWRRRPELFVYPALSFATATVSTLAFGVGVVPDALSIFWPLYMLVLTRGQVAEPLVAALILVGSACLAMSYDLSLLFFLGLLALTIAQRKAAFRSLLLVVFALARVWLAYRIFGPHAGTNQHFLYSIKQKIGLYRNISILLVAGLGAALYLRSLRVLYGALALALAITLTFTTITAAHWTFDLFNTFNARTTAIPLACVIALFAALSSHSRLPGLPARHLATFASSAIIIATLHQVIITRQWSERLEPLHYLLTKSRGCVYLPPETPRLGNDWSLPYLSTLLQARHDIKTIVFPKKEGQCELFNRGFLVDEHNQIPTGAAAHFDFSKAMGR